MHLAQLRLNAGIAELLEERSDSAPYIMGQIQQRQATKRGETVVRRATIEGYLSKPDGAGPFPAVVSVAAFCVSPTASRRLPRCHKYLGMSACEGSDTSIARCYQAKCLCRYGNMSTVTKF
jgi:hypothetical protein